MCAEICDFHPDLNFRIFDKLLQDASPACPLARPADKIPHAGPPVSIHYHGQVGSRIFRADALRTAHSFTFNSSDTAVGFQYHGD